jgi:integrase
MAVIKQEASGRWRVRIRKKGHSPISKTFRTKASAQSWANSTEDQIERGELIGNMVAAGITVGNLLDKYEREIGERKKGYMTSERYVYPRLKTGFKGVRLLKLSPDRVVEFADARLLTVGSDSVRRELAVLSAAWETAKSLWKYPLRGNPVKTANKMLTSTNTYSRKVERTRRLFPDEQVKLLAELSEEMQDLVLFALETAMRRGEIAITGGKNRVEGGLLIEDDKTGKTTIIPLSSRAHEILDKYPNGFGRKPDSITQAFNRARDRAGIKDLRVHDLRHEATSRMFEKGLSIEEVSCVTRHSDWRSLKRYTHPKNDIISKKLG